MLSGHYRWVCKARCSVSRSLARMACCIEVQKPLPPSNQLSRDVHAHLSADSEHVNTLATKLRDLNTKVCLPRLLAHTDTQLQDIQREQRYMREVEATFRDASEATNSRAVYWSIIQTVVLLATAAWQMKYLRSYFGDKKLR